ncbi:MAG: ATP-dependent helicase [Patescibacteria group bacterium]
MNQKICITDVRRIDFQLVMKSIDYSSELNQEQLDAVLHGDGPCLVLAGAGSGKTRTVTYRVAYLLEKGVEPGSILLLTFTNKAAREMLERIGLLVGPNAKGVWGGTFHSVANRILRSFASALGYTSGFSILDEEDAKALMKAVLKDAKIDPKARRFPSPAVLKNVYSYSRNTGMPFKEAVEIKHPNFLDCVNDMEWVCGEYQKRKLASNAMDFDDLLANWLKLMEHQPMIADQISSRFQYILVDEYQDTNILQARLINRLAHVHKNVFVVGDDAQSIYAFRGADVKNILSFPNEWPEAKIFKLLSNYRSTPQILDLANASLTHNQNQFAKDLVSLKEAGIKPKVISCPSARTEASYLADTILTLRSQGVALANMAVLFRASSHSQALEFELMKRDVPFEYRGGLKFFERAHVKDVLSYLRLQVNAKDEPAWLRVLNMQAGIGAATSSQILEQVRESATKELIPLAGELMIPARGQSGWADAQAVLIAMRDTTPGAMVRAVAKAESYRMHLEAEYPDWRDRLEDLEQLAIFADAYPDAPAFLADATLDDASFRREKGGGIDDQERLVLSTIHQAKGLEWDTVFVIHLTNAGFPSPRSLEEEGSLEEERRLFYVAVTRARNKLFLTHPQVMGYDAMNFCRPSMFLEELPSSLTESEQLARFQSFSNNGNQNSWGDEDQSWDSDWSDTYDEPVINLDRFGNRSRTRDVGRATSDEIKVTSVWKSSKMKKEPPKISFLRDVDEL